ncbi:MAG: hypothetical protein HY815_28490 [Candidatus Riflebacteria bacterium]|nr:hypothetical protein [Candidatus Riflebacteria bacterium]
MRWHGLIVTLALVSTWTVLSVWQHHEYVHECEQARESLRRQADAIGVRSHRRMGQYFQLQLQATLDEIVKAGETLAVGIVSDQGQLAASGGRRALLEAHLRSTVDAAWRPEGLYLAAAFTLAPDSGPGPHGGFGWGRGRRHGSGRVPADESPGPLASGGRFRLMLVLDRQRTDDQCRRALRLRGALAGSGCLFLLLLAVAWLTTLKAQARASLLEAEARHLRDLSQAASGLAHETRNPLGLVRGWTQRLADAQATPELREHARTVLEECDRIAARINQFLAFARPFEPSVSAVRVGPLVRELASIMEPDLEARKIELRWLARAGSPAAPARALRPGSLRLADDAPRAAGPLASVQRPGSPGSEPAIEADPEMIRQTLFNLIQNAVQFSPEGSTVEIELVIGHSGGYRLEVRDAGPGIPPPVAARLFTPYFTTRQGGTGLGLCIVRRIASAHGWTVGVLARKGGGTIFYLDGIRARVG